MSTAVEQSEAVLIAGSWREARAESHFQADNPAVCEKLPQQYPVSSWEDCEEALQAAWEAAEQMRQLAPAQIAEFLNAYAAELESHREELAALANTETALPVQPRLADVELPRTVSQLRQAAEAAANQTWAHAVIDTKQNIRSCYEPLGPICVFGPNNFPFAFNSVSGGDFAAAIAAGNPVIGKANTSHPGTTKRLAELAFDALGKSDLPLAAVQLLYRLSHSDGAKLVADPRVGAIGYTGSRGAGLKLKKAADEAGNPIYLELSSVNPVAILPNALKERGEEIVGEFITSVLMGTGQFCTNPGVILAIDSDETEKFISQVRERFETSAPGPLLSSAVQKSLTSAVETLTGAGAELLCGGYAVSGKCSVENTLLRTSAAKFLSDPEVFQTEAFGNASLVIVAEKVSELAEVIDALEGNLTGCLYTARSGADDEAYQLLAPRLARKVGRLLNDKMPTGVAVSPAMNHGGPFPATGHPGFTAVGIPASMLRFGKLTCYDAVRPDRLPLLLRDKNPTRKTWRFIDQTWTTADV